MSARDEILGRIRAANRAALTRPPDPPPERPRTGTALTDAVVALLVDRLRGYGATVAECSAADPAPQIAEALTDDDRVLVPAGVPGAWSRLIADKVVLDDAALAPRRLATIPAVLTGADAACAETGTLLLRHTPTTGRRMATLLPDHHVCVLDTSAIVATVPELVRACRPPQPVTLVSGPSATSDIELRRVAGVHGPRSLTVLLLRPEGTAPGGA